MNEDVDVDVKQTKNKRDVNIIIRIKKQTTSKQTKTNNRTFPNRRRTRKISRRINAMKINRRWCLDSHALCSPCPREKKTQNMIHRCMQQEKNTLFFPLLLPCLFVFSTVTQFHPKKTCTQVACKLKRVYQG